MKYFIPLTDNFCPLMTFTQAHKKMREFHSPDTVIDLHEWEDYGLVCTLTLDEIACSSFVKAGREFLAIPKVGIFTKHKLHEGYVVLFLVMRIP